jgi:hypothetical protein
MINGIEDILTLKRCSNNISTSHMPNMTLETTLHRNYADLKLSVVCWVLVGLNVFQFCIISTLVSIRIFEWKQKVCSPDTNIPKVALQNDFEMIENDMYGATAKKYGSLSK